jgi:uracil-DNA glycosylase family 4
VKHFKWEPRGTRRLHSKPSSREIAACRPWLEAEIKTIQPQIIVCLGATAAQSLLGNSFRITKQRGKPIENTPWAPCVIATVHPSSILRIPDHDARAQARQDFASDLRVAAERLRHEKRTATTRSKARADIESLPSVTPAHRGAASSSHASHARGTRRG